MKVKLSAEQIHDELLVVTITGGETRKPSMGLLWLTFGEWQLLCSALLMGAKQTQGHLTVEVENPVLFPTAPGGERESR